MLISGKHPQHCDHLTDVRQDEYGRFTGKKGLWTWQTLSGMFKLFSAMHVDIIFQFFRTTYFFVRHCNSAGWGIPISVMKCLLLPVDESILCVFVCICFSTCANVVRQHHTLKLTSTVLASLETSYALTHRLKGHIPCKIFGKFQPYFCNFSSCRHGSITSNELINGYCQLHYNVFVF